MNLSEFDPCPELVEFLMYQERYKEENRVYEGAWIFTTHWWYKREMHIHWRVEIVGRKWKNTPEVVKIYPMEVLNFYLHNNPKIYAAQVLYNLGGRSDESSGV